ncbi:glutamine-hydrolyzing carbamoyl-phosphate synthase small subunit [Cerasicoccus arenae]|uniref:Carbamoyl phosphate synthase small chain n=1 Tax=Cerasicoccus arenae TaxID=424488 RepID=A0A8J3DJ10_9BACT|nr:glutamine-hydrolyzing carbamoyl-phosphate synthase small subunit [Cerasicoccus arenae]MBK1856824.1 glutamine-hydrolyzing carbamoyl-phosphate synthase small subunit [Cerasicoccus arenae]GHC14031.1 carbamoyl-phosphate synthase small chain [Cerasicoccus arenae]
MPSDPKSAVLALEDGTVYRGRAFGAARTVVGEAVFNTSMTGYQEILTDPSYFAQIITMTAVQIGNYGTSPDDEESDGPKASGFVVRDLSPVVSNWRSVESLPDYLERHGVPGLSGVDTRAITKRLRVAGAMNACLSTEGLTDGEAVERAREWTGLVGVDYVKAVTVKEAYQFEDGVTRQPFTVPGTNLYTDPHREKIYKVAALDFGAKRSIFRKLRMHGFDVWVLPADASPEQIAELKPDALFLSNGPGDPAAVTYAHKTVAKAMQDYPTFGICFGHQVITHALDAPTYKLKFGHRGGNQPVKNIETGVVSITAQNHGFAAKREDLENRGAVVTEINLNDDTVEGLRHKDLPVFSVQYHPEAAPGPNDADPLFTQFYDMVSTVKG